MLVLSSNKVPNKHPPETHIFSLLDKYNATYWKVNIDCNHTPAIPACTYVDTLLRPNVVRYSIQKQVIIWAELPVPLGRNIIGAQLRKRGRYINLQIQLQLRGWEVIDNAF